MMSSLKSRWFLPAWGCVFLGLLWLAPLRLSAQVKKTDGERVHKTLGGAPPAPAGKAPAAGGMAPAAAGTDRAPTMAEMAREARLKADAAWAAGAPVPPPPGTELIGRHMNGEAVTRIANFWDGVDDNNNLHIHVAANNVLDDVGVFNETVFPASVNMVDMNDDKLADLVVCDRYGYLWIYFNAGEKGKPKFTTATLIPTFMGMTARINAADWDGDMDNDIVFGNFFGDFQVLANLGTAKQPKFTRSMGIPRFSSDPAIGLRWLVLGKSGEGSQGLGRARPAGGGSFDDGEPGGLGGPRPSGGGSLGGATLGGERSGGATLGGASSGGLGGPRPSGGGSSGAGKTPAPAPAAAAGARGSENVGGYSRAGESRSQMDFVLGLYMAPWVMDWNKDGKPDLIFGEGTYSANSVRIAFNTGSPGKASFNEDGVFFLAYGEGFEQLVPSVVDYNGDGIPDVMCGTRTGQIRLYKGAGRAVDTAHTFRGIKAPAALDLDRNLLLENLEVLETMTAPFPYDWNDDGLFDIVMGSKDGTILLALNRGTKTEPLFPRVEKIPGVNAEPDLLYPAGWTAMELSSGTIGRNYHCNSGAYLTTEKSVVLKGAGLANTNAVQPVEGERFLYFRYMQDYPGWNGELPGARGFSVGNIGAMVIGKTYVFSFSYIMLGRGTVNWGCSSAEGFLKFNLENKYNAEYDDYDGPEYVSWSERRDLPGITPLTPTPTWQKRNFQFTCPGVQAGQKLSFPSINVPGSGPQWMGFGMSFQMPEGDCQFCLDGFSLKEVGGPPPK